MSTALASEHRVSVEILGERFWVRGDAAPDYIAEVGRLVDSKLHALRATFPDMPKGRLAILACINLADELFQERREKLNHGDDEVVRRTRQLISLLDEGLTAELPDSF